MSLLIQVNLSLRLNGRYQRIKIEDVKNDMDFIYNALNSSTGINRYSHCGFEFHKNGHVINLGYFDESKYLSSWIMHVLSLEENEDYYDADQGWELIAKRNGDEILITQNDDPDGKFVDQILAGRKELISEWDRISYLFSELRKSLNVKTGCYSWII
jgi:hypothetical protein